MQTERSVRLVALWFRAATAAELTHGEEANPYWEPLHEANPVRARLGVELEKERSLLLSLQA
eukprot:2618180-Alexandrium_andersonii.AAC.1